MPFQWIENPDKPIADSTRRLYEQKLNTLARMGFTTRADLLNNSTAIVKFIDEKGSRQTRSLYYAAVFYILGYLDLDAEQRGKPFFEGFQRNYYEKK